MAEENVIQTTIVANSNMSGLISDLNRVSLALTKLQEQLSVSNKALATQVAAMNRTFAETLRSTGQFSTHFVSLTSDVDKFGQQLDKGQIKLSQFFRIYGQHTKTTGGLIRDLAKQQVQLQNAILQPLGRNAEGIMQYNVHIPRGLDLVKNKAAITRQELQIMNKVVQEGANQLINWGKNTQWAGRQLTVGLTVPMAAFGKASADAFKQADEQLVRLTKVYGGLAATSSSELKKVRKDVTQTASELARGYGASFTETLGLAADIAATGKQGSELLGSIKETTRLAVLGEVDRQEAMKATLAIQTAFKQNTQELSDSINFLNAVENQTSTTLADLVEAIPKAGPIIQGLGGSVQDLALYLTAMREGGVSAAEGANALKSALGSLINPTKVATGMFAGFGIDLKEIVQKNAGNVTGTILELQKALDTLDPLQKQQALEQLFGKFQFARMNALFSNLGKQGSQTLQVLDLMKASSTDLANIASRELTQVTESASGKYRRALEGLKADLAGIGDQFLRINTAIINIVDGVLKFAQNLPGPIKQLLGVMGMFTAIAGPLIMLTGVLGNFFGYIIKGVYHFKALFKGAEGWKLLTPQILAANKAGDMAEQTFYSDARAAAILKQSLDALVGSYTALETKLSSGVISTATGAREVIPNHPLLTARDTRAMSHVNPVGMMTNEERAAQTLYGVVPGAPLVNKKIGKAPQIYATGDLPDVPGLTKVGGVSTGIVAEEAAQWHAMTGALAMQSKAEIKKLKTEVATTGLITDELSTSYQALLPEMTKLTQKAAAESAEIVAELKAGKLTVNQARAKIIALNAEIEAMMGAATQQVATGLGRTANLTQVPLLNQPVVDPTTGKSNMKELFKPGRTRSLLNKIAGVLGVKTYGAPYSIETTRLRKLNSGGSVFFNDGDQVPGPSINADVVPAMLTPGEFVIRRDVAQSDPEGMRALNAGQAMIVPVERNLGGVIPMLRALQMRRLSISGLREAGARSGRQAFSANGLNFESMSRSASRGGTLLPGLQQTGYLSAEELSSLSGMIGAHGVSRGFLRNIGSRTTQGAYPTTTFRDVFDRFSLSGSFTPSGRSRATALRYAQEGRTAQVLPGSVVHIDGSLNTKIGAGTATRLDFAGLQGYQMTNLLDFLASQGIPPQLARRIANDAAFRLKSFLPASNVNEAAWAKAIEKAEQTAIIKHADALQRYVMPMAANKGGKVPRYANGGEVLAKLAARVASSRFRRVRPTNFGRLVTPSTGHSFPVPGIGGVYQKPDGSMAFVKPMMDERSALAELRATEIARRAHGLKAPQQTIRTMIDPTDPAGRRKLIVLESPYDEALGAGGTRFTKNQYFRQLVASLVRGDKDLSSSNVFGNVMADAGPAGVFGRASGIREYKHGMPSMAEQAMINLLGVKGGARKDFARSTAGLVRKMTPQQYHDEMIAEIERVLPKLKKTIASFKLNNVEKKMYDRMIARLEAGKNVDWKKFHGIHSNIKLNRGGRVPGYVRGGGVLDKLKMHGYWPGQASSKLNYQNGELLPGPVPRRMIGQGFGGQIVGSIVGGGVGTAVGGPTGGMIGSIGGSFLPMIIGKIAMAVKSAGGFLQVMLRIGSVLKSLTLPGLLLTGLVLAVKKLVDWKKAAEDAGKANRLAFGGTASSYASVGIKNYKSLTDRLKEYNDQLELNRAKIQSAYESNTKTGPSGVTYTIEQLNKAVKNAKQNQKDYVEAFNNIDSSRVEKYAASLKAQFVSLGLSASEASNQIYAIIKASNKASQATSAVSSGGFREITDQVSALKAILGNLRSNLGKTFNAEEFSKGIDTLANGAINYMNSLVNINDKTKPIVTQSEALAQTVEKIGKLQGKNNKLSADQLTEIKKQNIAYSSILGSAETLQSTVAKILMYQSGMSEVVNLAAMGAKEAISFAQNMTIVKDTISEVFSSTTNKENPLGPLANSLSKAKAVTTSFKNQLNSLQKFDKTIYEDKIKQQQKLIDKIDKERNARLKLLDVQEKAANFETDVKSAQIRYQEALAAGDMAQAAQEQLNIQQLTSNRQRELARQAINDKADNEIATHKKEIERLQGIIDSKARQVEKLTRTGGPSDRAADNEKTLQSYMDTFNALTLKYAVGKGEKPRAVSEEDRKLIVNTIAEMKKSGSSEIKALALELEKKYTVTTGASSQGVAKSFSGEAFMSGMQEYLNKEGGIANEKFNSAVDKFAKAVSDFVAPTGSKENPFTVSKGTKISRFGSDKDVGAAGSSWQGYGISSDREAIKDYAKQRGFKPGQYFETSAGKGKKNLFRVEQDGNITRVKANYADGGYVSGPGTATSDSIPAYLSNGEYVVNAASAASFGYDNLDKINKMAAGGIVKYDIPKMGLRLADGGGPVWSKGDTINVDKIHLEFNALPENPRQYGAELIQGIKLGRGRLVQSI